MQGLAPPTEDRWREHRGAAERAALLAFLAQSGYSRLHGDLSQGDPCGRTAPAATFTGRAALRRSSLLVPIRPCLEEVASLGHQGRSAPRAEKFLPPEARPRSSEPDRHPAGLLRVVHEGGAPRDD